jgi:hypothetical protein
MRHPAAPLLLPRCTEIDGFRGFVTGYGRLLPLRKPSPFGEAAMIRTLLELSGEITGKGTALLARAAEASILDGGEHIGSSTLSPVETLTLAVPASCGRNKNE